MINANIFGNMAVLLQGINRKASQFQEKLDTANTAMKNMKISDILQQKVQNYIMSTESTLNIQRELQSFLNLLSPSLRYIRTSLCFYRVEILSHIFRSTIEKNAVFRGNDDLVDTILPLLEMKVFLPEDLIIRQGDEGYDMYFIATGQCVVSVRDMHRTEREVSQLGSGNFFGVNLRSLI